jgi:hypothetical protein
MRKNNLIFVLMLSVLLLAGPAFAAGYTTAIYKEPGGNKEVVGSGGEIELQSGSTLDIQYGAVVTKPLNLRVPLFSARNVAGGSVAASAGVATDFITVVNSNNALDLQGTAAQNNTKTNDALLEVVLPDDYKAGTNITVYVSSGYSASGGTTITATVDLVATLTTDIGTAAADICATAATAITLTIGEKAFTVTGTTLTPGARLVLKVTTSVQEAGNTGTATGHVYGIRIG